MKMKSLFIAVCAAIFGFVLLNGESNAALPQLGYQGFGAPAMRLAVRIGPVADTVFVSVGPGVQAFAVNHASPSTRNDLNSIAFGASGMNSVLALHPTKPIILAASSGGLKIRDYLLNTDLTVPGSVGGGLTSVIFNASGNTAFVASGGTVSILDMTNPASSSVVGTIQTDYFVNALAFKGSGGADTLFTAGDGFKGLRVYNVTTPASPVLLATSMSGDSIANMNKRFSDIVVISDSIYIAEEDSGLRVFPRSNIASPGILTYMNDNHGSYISAAKGDSFVFISSTGNGSFGLKTRSIYTGGWSNYNGSGGPHETAAGFGNLLYVANYTGGLQPMDISSPFSPAPLGSGFSTGDYVYDVTGDDRNFAYIAAGQSGIGIMDLTSHTPIGGPINYEPNATYRRVLVRNNILYAFTDNSVNIIDVINPSSPALLGSYNSGLNGIRDAALSDSSDGIDPQLVIADMDGIKLLNAKNPAAVTLVSSIYIPGGGANHVYVTQEALSISDWSQRRVYASFWRGGLGVWNFSLPSSPSLEDSTLAYPPPFIQQFVKQGKLIHYIEGDSVGKIDASIPSNLIDLGKYYGPASPVNGFRSIAIAGKSLHLGTGNGQIMVVDTTTKTLVASFTNLMDNAERLSINGLNLFVAAQAAGYYHLGDNFGTARIRIPQMTGMPQDTVEARVKILDNLMNIPSMSFESFFTFDTSFVQFISLQRGSILPPGDSIVSALTHNNQMIMRTDTLKIARADTGNIGLGTDSTLLKIKLRIRNNAPVTPLLQYAMLNTSHFLIAEGTPGVDFRPGRINVVPRFGDANQNGMLSPTDASLILQYIIGLMPAPPLYLADVSANGETRAFDAALILRKLLYVNYKFPVEVMYNLKTAPVNKEAIVTLMTDASGAVSEGGNESEAGVIIHGISLKNISQMLSAEMTIDLGPGQRFAGYELSPLAQGMTVEYRQEGNILHLAMAGAEAIEGEGEFIRLKCQVIDAEGLKPVEIMEFLLNESLVENIQGSGSGVPRTYALGQNYPNPFNPVTTILYQLPNENNVTLVIYNILGQQVRVLVNAKQQAGYYSMKWDGRDELGSTVASGVYFYRIQAGSYMKTKKMLFMK